MLLPIIIDPLSQATELLTYVISTQASQTDVSVYRAFQAKYPNLTRWLNHMGNKTDSFESFPKGSGAPAAAEDDDEDVDLFGSDDEVDEEAERIKAERVAEYQKRKAEKGPKAAAKSIVTLEIKPWDDETDLDEMLAHVKSIEMEGLTWGAHQYIPIGFGIKKLQMNCVVQDDKVSLDELQEAIEADEDHVQSTDVAAMQKL